MHAALAYADDALPGASRYTGITQCRPPPCPSPNLRQPRCGAERPCTYCIRHPGSCVWHPSGLVVFRLIATVVTVLLPIQLPLVCLRRPPHARPPGWLFNFGTALFSSPFPPLSSRWAPRQAGVDSASRSRALLHPQCNLQHSQLRRDVMHGEMTSSWEAAHRSCPYALCGYVFTCF
ncbi:hypothetical protein BV20DRAFT_1117458 [Pilatotrama ljubarskyi]|nr:hypothetical protein BV20DRAFT_1117458 [Pilatotrama ljubarskyi]